MSHEHIASPEDEQEKFYAAIGKAITQWQHVEARLGFIFAEAMGLGGSRSGNMAFHSIISFDGKLTMTNAALSGSGYSDACMAAWRPLLNKLTRRNKRRNTLAHFMLHFDATGKPGYRYHLRPNVFDLNAQERWKSNPPRLNLYQVKATGEAFETLADELINFWRLMAREQWTMKGGLHEVQSEESHPSKDHPNQELQTPSGQNDTGHEDPLGSSQE